MTEAGVLGKGARPSTFAVWIQAIRAPSLTAAAIPVLLGMAVAARDGFFSLPRLLLALVGAMAIQAGTNLINDYYDYRSGADLEQTLGPSMVIQRGLLTAEQVWRGGVVAFAIGAALGLVLVYLAGWPILWIGAASVAAGYFYTAKPLALAYLALGELTVFIFMGPAIVLGTYNIRDIETDRRHGKRTLATILGRTGANRELVALDVAAYATTLIAVLTRELPWVALAVFITVPRALDQIRIVMRESEPKKLNLALMRSVQLHMEFGLVLTLAMLVAAFLRW
jgi:1,4-dihydroxy-2-naphthoate polyprenyltransferase